MLTLVRQFAGFVGLLLELGLNAWDDPGVRYGYNDDPWTDGTD